MVERVAKALRLLGSIPGQVHQIYGVDRGGVDAVLIFRMTTGTVEEDPSVVGGGSKTSLFQPPTTDGLIFVGLLKSSKFWRQVKIGPIRSCWNMIVGSRDKKGYRFHTGSLIYKEKRAHRAAYILMFGQIPNGLLVCHHCDNPSCCNPWHLFVGTIHENNHDMFKKKRHHQGPRIKDALSELPISAASKWQFRKKLQGLCTVCGQKPMRASLCEKHWLMKQRANYKRRHGKEMPPLV